ncbi:DUF72 domain-containing protein [Thiorhodococcus mannitoliphagus]|uniref:DUF72 domain-containing protein n=1 Tax=Thiorhodococcus mannitoliphagus TaxID=329406 RepID=A0A6P1DZP3_9GAMM|nr:DUF72 domain-containing protein [Thiorhodococcus mannitoliphagus]NEX23159.1 DUF72 domain-containing protein [Thiorhodococcus mannitoliphagus]
MTPKQLDLFGEAPDDASPLVRPARSDWAKAAERAGALPSRLRFGTSSWAFPGWIGLVYDQASDKRALSRHGLDAYARHPLLRTVGVDSAYHAPVPTDRLRAYATQVPNDFRFLVKTPALVTDPFVRAAGGRPTAPNARFLEPTVATEFAVRPFIDGLGDHGGVLLLQFPPLGKQITANPRRFAEDLYRFLRRLPSGPIYAVELRDRELLTRDFAEALRHGGAHAARSLHPRLPALHHQNQLYAELPRGPLIVRWMLRSNRGYQEARMQYRPFDRLCEPDPAARAEIADLVSDGLEAGREVYVIANNKAEGCAPLSLMALADALRGNHRRGIDGRGATSVDYPRRGFEGG